MESIKAEYIQLVETIRKDEILSQAEAFKKIHGNILDMIDKYAKDFRQIIIDFEKQFNRVPTADDLLWISSEHHGRDIRYN